MNDLVTIVVLIIPFVFVIAITWINSNEKQKRRQLQADLYAKALEKGQPIPTDLFAEDKKQKNPLNEGILLIAVGIGLALFIWLFFNATAKTHPNAAPAVWIASVGLIPFMAGVAQLIIYFIEKKKTANKDAK